MVMDALRGYVQLASGLTEVTKQRAQQAAKALLQQTKADSLTSGITTRVSDLADEIVATSKSNRALLQAIITNEVEGAVSRLGFVRSEEVAALARRVESLEKDLAAARAAGTTTPSSPSARSGGASTSPSSTRSGGASTSASSARSGGAGTSARSGGGASTAGRAAATGATGRGAGSAGSAAGGQSAAAQATKKAAKKSSAKKAAKKTAKKA
jgi:polyhydroxyalkanoate synthesis regulator phasin